MWRTVLSLAVYPLTLFWILAFVPGLPPTHVRVEMVDIHEDLPFVDGLAQNDLLDRAEILSDVVDGGELGYTAGPESFAARDGFLYSGVRGGDIIRLDVSRPNDHWQSVFNTGSDCYDVPPNPDTCGLPLGMVFGPDGSLVVADGFKGVLQIDLKKGEAKTLVKRGLEFNGRANKLVNSVAVSSKGTVYYTVPSTSFEIWEGALDILVAGSGRVMAFDPATDSHRVLADDMAFVNGIALSEDEDFLVVCEAFRQRLWKIWLGDGSMEALADTPGVCDNVKPGADGRFVVGISTPTAPGTVDSIARFVLPFPSVSTLLLRLLYLVKTIPQLISQHVVSSPALDRFAFEVISFENFMDFIPKYGLAVEYDSEGRVTRSWHAPAGAVSLVSEAFPYKGYLYFGGPFGRTVARIPYKETHAE